MLMSLVQKSILTYPSGYKMSKRRRTNVGATTLQRHIFAVIESNFITDNEKVNLTLKAPITTAADDIHKYFFIVFLEKIRLDVSSESSARQRIHVKNQALLSSKYKSKKLKCRLLQLLFGAIRVIYLYAFQLK